MTDLPAGPFGCILADPPWRFKTWSPGSEWIALQTGRAPNRESLWQTFRNRQIQTKPENHYSTMAHDEMCAMPVGSVAAKDCVLLLWVVDSMIPEALQVGEAWGFKFKTSVFIWAKGREGVVPHPSLGYWSRKQAEQCFLFTRGAPKRLSKGVEQIIFCPRGPHSAKPEQQYDRIEALVGGPYLELFARRTRKNWSSWGNEVGVRDGTLFA